MTNIEYVEENYLTAREFLHAILPTGKYFQGDILTPTWLFRGQGQDWKLVPPLFRKDKRGKDKIKSMTKNNIDSYEDLLVVERDFLLDFFQLLTNAVFRSLTIRKNYVLISMTLE